MRGRLCLLLSLSLLAGFAPAPLPRTRRADPEKDDLRKMQGTWVVLRYERNGMDHARGFAGTLYITFQGNRMSYVMNDNDVRSRWGLVLSPGSSPRALTATRDDRRFINQGIYR